MTVTDSYGDIVEAGAYLTGDYVQIYPARRGRDLWPLWRYTTKYGEPEFLSCYPPEVVFGDYESLRNYKPKELEND